MKTPVEDRIRALSSREGECLLFLGHLNHGYGMVHVGRIEGKQITGYVHRLIWQEVHGPIPEGLEINHSCRRRNCIELTHLEVTTPQGNVLDSPLAIASINTAKTRCPQGHPLSGANLAPDARGYRRCRACRNQKARDAKRAKDGIPPERWRV